MSVDPTTHESVGLAHSSTSAPSGPSRGDPRAEGFLSSRTTVIRCQVRTLHGICDRSLAVIVGRAYPTGRTVRDLDELPVGHPGGYCPRCKRASVYTVEAA
jgi:hypothetical protein